MSGQRNLRLAALIIGALGATRLLWLVVDVIRLGPVTGWWLEAAFYGVLVLNAVLLLKGSDLAWFGAVVIFACGVVTGIDTLLDLLLAADSLEPIHLAQTALLLGAGLFGLWALLVSPEVKTLRAARGRRDPYALIISITFALIITAGVGWYLDRLSPEIQRTLGEQAGIATAFAALVAFLAARNRKTPVRWEYLPLVVAGVVLVANLEIIAELRTLRPAAAALAAAPPESDADLAAILPGTAFRITTELQAARRETLARLEAHTGAIGPWPQMAALTPDKVADPAAIDAAAAALAVKSVSIREAAKTYDAILGRFVERRRKIIAPLSEALHRRVDRRFEQEENAYRSHYGARVHLLSRAAGDLAAMLAVLQAQRGRYAADWGGALTFQDAAAQAAFQARQASLEELVVWNGRLRAEGAALAESRPAWAWLKAAD
ncbi:hypothetical protein [Emcibacter sp. SYSU 3D8]|uniref:hypothetical protein n=1 Tax=Emcibacter sp. SYSU 3D8 TaxID=3133969 RepID=UPI0031FF1FCA